ncbi:phosphotransferase enzyme family protein [Paenibacillus sp. YIM B09110]|uniref:phosphotransferase enzyme family protein n=1 Tax=Paenibacillus sp. YIM B09110 TaxID=3126102 RepID=UPI00301B84A6
MNDPLGWIRTQYFHDRAKIETVPFGLTNTTGFVSINNQKFVIRKYDSYLKSIASLSLEISVTSFLKNRGLTFDIPGFLPTLGEEAYVILPDGALGVCNTYIEGAAPIISTPRDAEMLGLVVGEMSSRLSEYVRPKELQYGGVPFTDLYGIHPLIDQEEVESFWNSPPFPISVEQKQVYDQSIASVKENLEEIMSLPRQLVHHDLLIFNLLATDQVITGVLDFDFLSVDIAFLEFSISFNHVLQLSGGSLDMAVAFVEGYSAFRTFTTDEFRQLRLLTRLYHVAVLHIYIGQYLSGKDVSLAFTHMVNQLIERDSWLGSNAGKLERMFASSLEQ